MVHSHSVPIITLLSAGGVEKHMGHFHGPNSGENYTYYINVLCQVRVPRVCPPHTLQGQVPPPHAP